MKKLREKKVLVLLKSSTTFARVHLDYDDIIYDQPSNATLSDKVESVQYNAGLAIKGDI